MTNVVKCSACNIVIDELLSYLQNKISVIDEETLVRICISSFTSEEIQNSKSLLFDSIPTSVRKITRKTKGKEERDLADMVNLFKSSEPDVMPVFVARQLEKLPPITFDHLDCTKLLKDLLLVKSDLMEIKSNYVTQNMMMELKSEVLQMKNNSLPPSPVQHVNTKRGAWTLHSGLLDLSQMPNSSLIESHLDAVKPIEREMVLTPQHYRQIMGVESRQCQIDLSVQKLGMEESPAEPNKGDTVVCVPEPRLSSVTVPAPVSLTSTQQHNSSSTHQLDQCENVVPTQNDKQVESERVMPSATTDTWQVVSRRKKPMKYRYSGRAGLAHIECNFKAADKNFERP